MNTHNPVFPVLNWMEFVASKFSDRYKSKISLFHETSQYVLKTAECSDELEAVLKLRHQVFYQELQNKKNFFKIELDRLDFKCDHLLIIDKATEQVVGCYRLLSSHFFKRFYSETEFDLTELLKEPGAKLELGRACILPSHRNGPVIQLLWRGITEYMKKTETRFLMGCSSIQTTDPLSIVSHIRKINIEGWVDTHYQITPRLSYHPFNHGVCDDLFTHSAQLNNDPELPPLILAYLKAGAKLAPLPAVDLEFNCVDFFTLLDRKNMNPLFLRRYFGQ